MQETQQLQRAQPQSSFTEGETEDKGAFLSPPQFKLEASSVQAKEHEVVEADGSVQGGYVENVANLAMITQKIQNFVPKGNEAGLSEALEELKHDPVEVAHFRKYFAEKIGKSFREYMGDYFTNEAADVYERSLDYTKETFRPIDVAEAYHEYLEAGETASVYKLMSFTADIKAVSAAYKERYKGQDLYTDLVAASTPENDFSLMANKVFGKVQNNEKVNVNNEAEAQEAREIIARIYEKYGVEVNSQKGLDAVLRFNPDAPKELTGQIKTSTWTLAELQALERSFEKFGDFLNPPPTLFETYAEPQNLTSIGKVNKTILNSETNTPYITENVGGESFSSSTIAIFDNAKAVGFEDRYQSQVKNTKTGLMENQNDATSQESVMGHELGHAILGKHLDEFMKVGGYWATQSLSVETSTIVIPGNEYPISEFKMTKQHGIEAPITDYGCWNAKEDMAESVTLFLNNPSLLLNGHPSWHKLPKATKRIGVTGNPCPKRYAFIKKIFDNQAKSKL